MTDTSTAGACPPSRLDKVKAFIGDLARPFAIVSTSGAASVATVVIAVKVTSFGEGAIFIGAVFAGVGALYAAKSWELNTQARQAAGVEIARTAAAPTSAAEGTST
jgi:hypothetical protein